MKTRMKSLGCAFVCLVSLITTDARGQASVRKMSSVINHPSLNVYAPYISADANAIVFLSDNAEDHALTPFFSYRDNADWREPQVFPKTIATRLNFLRGYSLTADGGTLLYTTMKGPGVGGFDIWSSEWRGTVWANPVNMGAPVNSRAHEGCPSMTPDEKTMYFMRCDKMDMNKADQCKLLRIDKKSNGQWGEPVELPDYINTGNSQAPRIMADGETLIFSSNKMKSGKGGMDLYVSSLRNGVWTNPVPLDFVNTDQDDQYVSVTGLGRYLLRDTQGARKRELTEYLIPGELRPKGVMKVDGSAVDNNGKPVPAYVSLVDIETGKRVYNGRPNSDGSFLIYAREGSRYELSIDPEHADKSYYSKIIDLTRDPIPQVEKIRAVLKPLSPGDEFALDGIMFQPYSAELDLDHSSRALQRFARMITSNPGLRFEVEVSLEGYLQDSVRSIPDLTEVLADTVYQKYVDIDTLGQLYERDTAVVKMRYHNDRTARQAQAIIDYLVTKGCNPANLLGSGDAAPALLPEERKMRISVRIL